MRSQFCFAWLSRSAGIQFCYVFLIFSHLLESSNDIPRYLYISFSPSVLIFPDFVILYASPCVVSSLICTACIFHIISSHIIGKTFLGAVHFQGSSWIKVIYLLVIHSCINVSRKRPFISMATLSWMEEDLKPECMYFAWPGVFLV